MTFYRENITGTSGAPRRYDYDAFLSYNQEADQWLALLLKQGLHRFTAPWYGRRALHVFLDDTSMSATANMRAEIRPALDRSRFFILLAGPESAASPWVDWELKNFLETHGIERVLIVVTAGGIAWDADSSRFAADRTNCLSPFLQEKYTGEPRYLDLRGIRAAGTPTTWRAPQLLECVADLAAPLHGRPKEELHSADLRARRRAFRLVLAAVAVIVCLLAVTVVALANVDEERRRADAQARLKTAQELTERADQIADHNPELSQLLSVAAWRTAPSDGSRAGMIRAMDRRGVGVLPADMLKGALKGLPNSLWSGAFSTDGRVFASSGIDMTVRLWDVRSHRQLERPLREDTQIDSVAFSPDGRTLATGDADGRIRLWSWHERRLVSTFPRLDGTMVSGLAFDADGETLFSTSGGTVRKWSVNDREQIAEYPAHRAATGSFHPSGPHTMAVSANGRVLVTVDQDTRARISDTSAGGGPRGLPGSGYSSAAVSPNGTIVATGSADGTVQLWDASTQRLLGGVAAHKKGVTGVVFSPNGRTMASASADGTAQLWDVATRRPVESPLAGHSRDIRAVAVSPDGRLLATVCGDGTVRLWDASLHRPLAQPYMAHGHRAISFVDHARVLVTSDSRGTVQTRDVASGRLLGSVRTATRKAPGFALTSPDGGVLAIASGGALQLWDARTFALRGTVFDRDVPVIVDAAFSPGGRYLAVAVRDGSLLIWDVGARRPTGPASINGDFGVITGVAYSPDGRVLALSSDDSTVRLWDPRTREIVGKPFAGHVQRAYSVAFDATGRMLAAGGQDGKVRLWSTDQHRSVNAELTGPVAHVYTVRFSPDGRTLVAAGIDGAAWLWDAASQSLIGAPLPTASAPAGDLQFSSDGRRLTTIDRKGVPTIWDVRDTVDQEAQLCARAGRSLTKKEWRQYASGLPFRELCP
ncbi:TIR domain-containing protein [Actinomadura sp. K4S16]|uniref:toll/interleukin-1 receptor domain-containing protein n=1 Tax=Actinomadura sp. K4S16 TaxID=1316147 RepID=UPI0011EDFFE6|nr:TIR domain-containing protein [Actinomadura sp. K4S16]